MKEIIGNNETLPQHLIVDRMEISDAKSIAKKFNKRFVNIRLNFANKIPKNGLTFKSYLPKVNTTLNETVLSKNEYQEAFKSIKRNETPGHDGLDVTIITSLFELITKPLPKFLNEPITLSIFP